MRYLLDIDSPELKFKLITKFLNMNATMSFYAAFSPCPPKYRSEPRKQKKKVMRKEKRAKKLKLSSARIELAISGYPTLLAGSY